jgi:hypothetical protein
MTWPCKRPVFLKGAQSLLLKNLNCKLTHELSIEGTIGMGICNGRGPLNQ